MTAKISLEELRKQRGIKQEDLAMHWKYHDRPSALGKRIVTPFIQLAFKIARYFNMSIEEIFTTRRIDYEKGC